MAFNFGNPETETEPEHGKWGIGDMDVHFYVSPILLPEHKQAVREAIAEFFRLFPDKKDWFKIKEMPYQKVADIVNNQPTTIKDVTNLHYRYYWDKFE
ncbi:MAG: hypothetical protein J6T57_02975 [Alphaproteobacteria bacterium]|nr:hypothetical protein [Alphaproteobacteria bacterium]